MVRSVIAEESMLHYLQNLTKTETFVIGLILGQPSDTKDYVIHLARTPRPAKSNVNETMEGPSTNSDGLDSTVSAGPRTSDKKVINSLSDVPESWVADHARHATRMLPGGMYVLGIFIVSENDILSKNSETQRIKSILSQMTKQLGVNKHLRGLPVAQGGEVELLIINYAFSSNQCSAKSCAGFFKPADIKFLPKVTKWHQLECTYQFDQHFPVTKSKINWSLKKHMQGILVSLDEILERGVIMIDGELRERDESLDMLGKKKKNAKSKSTQDDGKPMQAIILLPCAGGRSETEIVSVLECSGDMRIIGQLASRVFLHQKASVEDATKAIKEDIVRSLAARLEMHSDSLIEEEHGSPEERQSVHEPPRRVLVPLPTSRVTLSDYLFPGEGPSEALISLEELLDLKVNEGDVIKDLEIQADSLDLSPTLGDGHQLSAQNQEAMCSATTMDTNKLIYYIGLAFALIVLVASLLIHLLKQQDE